MPGQTVDAKYSPSGKSDEIYRQMLEVSNAAIFLINSDLKITKANRATSNLFALPAEKLTGTHYPSLLHPSQIKDSMNQITALLNKEKREIVNHRRLYLRPDGTEFWGRVTCSSLYDENDSVVGIITVLVDISEELLKEKQLKLMAGVFTYAREAIMITDAAGIVVDVNESFTKITGYTRDEAVGNLPKLLKSKQQNEHFYDNLKKDVLESGHWTGEIWSRRKSGELYPMLLTISEVVAHDNSITHYVTLFNDIGKIKERERNLEKLIHFDAETGLPNRLLLTEKISALINQPFSADSFFAVSFVDFDNFDAITEQYGTEIVSRLLFVLAKHMNEMLKDSDDMIFRVGGEQFIILFTDIKSAESLHLTIDELHSSICESFLINDSESITLSASIGVSVYSPKAPVSAEQLINQAGQAMYKAMLEGKNQVRFFDAAENRSVIEFKEKQEEIKHALETGQFVLFYQPKVNMVKGRVIGLEALIRWKHPQKGLMPPASFLKYTESLPLSVLVDDWVTNAALAQMDAWARAGINIPVSINMGAMKFEQHDFVDFIKQSLSRYPAVNPANFEIEILEGSSLNNLDTMPDIINDLRRTGVHIAIDDFGTGYSSITYLRMLPADILKIDQSFVREVLVRPNDFIILENIINLSKSFGRDFIAEGVETEAHGTLLIQLGCEKAQGYSISAPMPAESVPAWLQNYTPNPVWRKTKQIARRFLPILLSKIEHLTWANSVSSCSSDGYYPAPMLDISKCRFSAWLHNEYMRSPHLTPELDVISGTHTRVHVAAELLCSKKSSSDSECSETPNYEEAFYNSSMELIRALDSFIEKV